MAEALARRGHTVHVITYGYGEYEYLPSYRMHRIPTLPLPKSFRSGPHASKLLLDPLLALKIIGVASREKAEILHAHNHEAVFASWPAAKLLGVPLVYHSHTILEKEFPTYWRAPRLRAFAVQAARALEKLTFSMADHLIAVSEEELRHFALSGRRPEDMTCITPGIAIEENPVSFGGPLPFRSPSPLSPSPEGGGEGEGGSSSGRECEGSGGGREHDRREEEGALCYMGNLDEYQDLTTLFRAVKLASARRGETTLYVVTRSPWEEHLKRAESMGIERHVRFIRPDTFPEALSLLERCPVSVITRNIASGFPVKLLNYMASGRAIIATRSSSKMLAHGENALVVEDGDQEGLARAILLLMEDPALRRRLGENARTLAKNEFSWEARTGLLESLYGKLLEKKDAGRAA
jgi:glycosyltransferase involved in cell wall biosynthesis